MFSNPRKYLPHMHTKNPLIKQKLFTTLEISSYLQVSYTCKLFNRWIKRIDLVLDRKILLNALVLVFQDQQSTLIIQKWLHRLISENNQSKSHIYCVSSDLNGNSLHWFIRNCTILRNNRNKPHLLRDIPVVIDRVSI